MAKEKSLVDVFKTLREHFEKQPAVMIDSAEKVLVVGDVHGDLETMRYVKKVKPKYDRVVFVGDFVDRGENDIEVVQSLPDFMSDVILAGNHDADINTNPSDFIYKVKKRFGDDLWYLRSDCVNTFANAPIAYYNPNHKLLVVHGGIPLPVNKYHDIKLWKKYSDGKTPESFQIMWNDFSEGRSMLSERGDGMFNVGVTDAISFMDQNNLELIVRGHDSRAFNSVLDLSEEKKVVTVGSSSYYAERKGRAVYDVAKKKLIEF